MAYRTAGAIAALATPALVVLATTTLAPATNADQPIVHGELGRALDGYLERLEGVGFSGVVLVAKDGTVVLEKGYGLADPDTGRPVKTDTVYTVGSITKQFTAAAIMKLASSGELDVDDPITKFFDDVPEDKQTITIHHLLTHTAGFPGAIGDDFDPMATRDRVLEQALRTELLASPGAQYQYSNVGYTLLGMIIEKVSGQPYEAYLLEQLFRPTGMTRTGYVLPAYSDDELAIGYRDADRWGTILGRPMLADGPCWHLRANGGVHSTTRDMYRWHQALEGESVLSADAKRQVFFPHADEGGGRSHYGYGWAIFETPWGSKLIAHNGGNGIFSADFRRYVDDGFVIFGATSHSRYAPFDLISEALAEIVMGREVAMPPATTSFDQEAAGDAAGTYELDGGGSVVVEAARDRLLLRGADRQAERVLSGELDPDDPRARQLAERTERVVRGWMRDDFAPMLDTWGGRMSGDEVKAALRRVRAMREERYGAFADLRITGFRANGPAVAVAIMMEHARGGGPLQLEWRDGRIVGVMLGGDGRETGTLHLFPTGEGAYTTFDLRAAQTRTAVRFSRAEGGKDRTMILDQDGRVVTATRTP